MEHLYFQSLETSGGQSEATRKVGNGSATTMVPHKLGVAGKLFLLEFKVNENVTKCRLTAGMMMPVNIDVLTLLPSMVFTTFYILIYIDYY